MKFYTFFVLLCVFNLSDLCGQSFNLCSIPNDLDQVPMQVKSNDLSIQIENNGDVYRYIEQLMSTVNLPMNFYVYKCVHDDCKNNAYAKMNRNGTRFIVYDDSWFQKLKRGTNNVEILTVLAHEIGHHLSAHTLGLDRINREKAIATCNSRSKTYNKKLCDSVYRTDYENYLYDSRMNELEADRFSGYIMYKYGASLSEIEQFFFNFFKKDHNDEYSTHPTLSKRLKAIRDGYQLAKAKGNNTDVSLNEIKGNPIEIVINEIESFKKYQLIEKLQRHIINIPVSFINRSTQYEILEINAYGGINNSEHLSFVNTVLVSRIRKHLGNSNALFKIDEDSEYFECFRSVITFEYNKEVFYTPFPAIHIKNGILTIFIFENKDPKVVYKSPFNEHKISFKEIESIFTELFERGFKKAISEHEKERN